MSAHRTQQQTILVTRQQPIETDMVIRLVRQLRLQTILAIRQLLTETVMVTL